MPKKLHPKEVQHLMALITLSCKGTPLQDNAEFAGGYLGSLLVSQLENWDVVRKSLGLPSEVKDKVVYNACFGGFGLSWEAWVLYHELQGLPEPTKDTFYQSYGYETLERDDPFLVQVVETLGDKANAQCAKLRIETVHPNRWNIKDHDGNETVEHFYD